MKEKIIKQSKKEKIIEPEKLPEITPVTTQTVKIIEKEISKEPVLYITYSRAQLDQIKDIYAKGTSDIEFANFIVVASRTGLDIFKKQIYLVPRWDARLGKEIFTPQTGIDGLRSIAERTDAYAGNEDPVFDGWADEKLGYPDKATVTVYKIVQGQRYPFTATARWKEYYPGDKVGFMWKQKPHIMLGKCAEALALRKAFPNNIGGIYTQEEMAMQDAQLQPLSSTKVQDAQLQPLSSTKVDVMFEKAKVIIAKKTDPNTLYQDIENIQKSEKYNEKQKKEMVYLIEERIKSLTQANV